MTETKDTAPPVLVFIVASPGNEEAAIEALTNGARQYLKKPSGEQGPAGIGPVNGPEIQSLSVASGQYLKIQHAVRFINDNYRTDIRLGSVADQAGMSPSHFSRTFKKVMGLSYQGYLHSRRITEAKKLLRKSPQSITEIAEFLGFSDPTAFGRIFKKLTGQTPSAFRSLPRERFLPKKAEKAESTS